MNLAFVLWSYTLGDVDRVPAPAKVPNLPDTLINWSPLARTIQLEKDHLMKFQHSPKRDRVAKGHRSPSKALVAKIQRLRRSPAGSAQAAQLSDAYRKLLREYSAVVSQKEKPSSKWIDLVCESVTFLGGQPDRETDSLVDYDHRRFGPFLGVSDEGDAAPDVRRAAAATPKARALGRKATPLTVGIAVDAERLGGVGEVPVGPEEYARVWRECVGQLLTTTSIGSRVNFRTYRRPPLVTIADGNSAAALDAAKGALDSAFKPFVNAPGGARPLTAHVEFQWGTKRRDEEQVDLLRELQEHVAQGTANSKLHGLALKARIGWEEAGYKAAVRAIDIAGAAGVARVVIDGVVRKDADAAVSLPGLLNYLPAEFVTPLLQHAERRKIAVRPINPADADTTARIIWSALNTARAMGIDLGKYGLFPLELEESDEVVKQVQAWFPGWSAAPVFYVDQGVSSRNRIYVGADTAKGVELWLRSMARHRVKICLIDTVDKSQGWKILKSGNDPKGIFEIQQIARLDKLAQDLGIRTLWAGGITLPQAYEFGKLGVFGIYVTSAVSVEAPVGDVYRNDPALATVKQPTFEGVLEVKTLIEAGFLVEHLGRGTKRPNPAHERLRLAIEKAGLDAAALALILPSAWRAWWQSQPAARRRAVV